MPKVRAPRRSFRNTRLGDWTFHTKRDIEGRCRSILAATTPGTIVARGSAAHRFLVDLFARHPEIRGKGDIKVDRYDGRFGRRAKNFWIQQRSGTGTWVAISFKACLAPTDPCSRLRGRYTAALRILVDDQIREIRAFRGADVHVDHCGLREFRHLVDDFTREHAVDVKALTWVQPEDFPHEAPVFDDVDLQDAWKAYHKEHARLQLVPAAVNLAKPRK